MARLDIALLGSVRVTLDGQAVAELRYDKVRALLAYLAVENDQPHSRAALAALLWPDAPESAARKSFRNALATLRQAIGDTGAQPPFLLITRDTVQLNPAADIHLDVQAFDECFTACEQHPHVAEPLCPTCATNLAQASDLYHGVFLDQIRLDESLEWDEWVLITRERLHRQVFDALTQLAAYHEFHGQSVLARTYAWRALALEPLAEAMHRCLMRILANTGQRNAALAQYQRCQKILTRELGVEPAAETTALYQRIRTGRLEKTADATCTSQARACFDMHAASPLNILPDAITPSIPGRATSTRQLNGQGAATRQVALADWSDTQLRLLAHPPSGSMIRFGLAIAATPQDAIADEVCFVALAPVRDPALIAALGQGAHTARTEALTARLQEYMRNKTLQLVLDTFEQVLASTTERSAIGQLLVS